MPNYSLIFNKTDIQSLMSLKEHINVVENAFRLYSEGDILKPGMTFTARGPEGQVQEVIVEEVSDAGIKVNANHPLAGKVLHFDVSVEDVRAPTPEDLDAYTQGIDEA